jgi:hypothetical protein
MWRLPVSGTELSLRGPEGNDDLLLYESTDRGLRLALEIASRLARRSDGEPLRWEEATLTDLDAVLIFLRVMQFGFQVRAEAVCSWAACRRRIDVSFGLDIYLRSNQPAAPRGITADGDGWYRLADLPPRFRLPTVSDLLEAGAYPDSAAYLRETCIQPQPVARLFGARLERAMSAMAPNLAQGLTMVCPECRLPISVWFDPIDYTLRELRGPAARVHQEVHVLASTYHWPEAEILALPRQRRAAYVELAEQSRALD